MTTRIASTNIQSNTILTTNLAQSTIDALQGSTVPTITQIQITTSGYVVKDDTAVSTSGGYIKITGTNFTAGSQVVIGSTPATSVGFVNSTTLNVQVPPLSAGTYVVYVTINTGSVAIMVNGLTYSGDPAWVTGSTLTSGQVDSAISIQLSATGDAPVTYALQAGSSLPAGLTLTSGGLLSGTVTGITVETTYNFTIEAIDAQAQESPRTFSITITSNDQYFEYVTTLLSASNPTSTFVTDASTNNFAVTVFGDTRPNNFGPYTPGYYSNFFDGTGDYLSSTITSTTIGTGNFTVECWVYPTAAYGNLSRMFLFGPGAGIGYLTFYITSSGQVIYGPSGTAVITTTSTVPLNTWTHIAISRSSGTTNVYLNGVSGGSAADTTNYPATTTFFLGQDGSGNHFTGYISNFRLVNGSAVYTSAFTPPTTPLTAVTNTALLLCQSNRFIDTSTNNFTITRFGDTLVSGFDPFAPLSAYSTYGSGYFDGSGDYLSVPDNEAFNLPADFTIECWLYPTSHPAAIYLIGQTSNTDYAPVIVNLSNGRPGIAASATGSSWFVNANTTNAIPLNTWTHIAAVRSGNKWSMYINGIENVLAASAAGTPYNSTDPLGIGSEAVSPINYPYVGYIADVRIVKGTAVYTSNFTPPAAPLAAITNTSLLTLQNNQPNNNNMFLDSSSSNFLITRNGNTTQGSFSPYGGGWSNYFDGTGDYLSIAHNTALNLSSGNFTIEAWVWWSGTNSSATIIDKGGTFGSTYPSYDISMNGSGFVKLELGSGSGTASIQTFTSSTSLPTNQWVHIAAVKNGTTVTLYQNGVSVAGATQTVTMGDGGQAVIVGYQTGQPTAFYWSGYITNLRIVKGTAVYTSAFTPPTAPLTPITNTSLLTCADNRFIDDSANNFTVTRNGDVSVQRFNPFNPVLTTPTSYSGYFDGTGDYLTAPNNAATTLNADFTIEFWVYRPVSGNNYFFCLGDTITSSGIEVYIGSTGSALIVYSNGANRISSATLPAVGTWSHVAVVRAGTTVTLYLNGASLGTWTSSATFSGTTYIGAEFFNGSVTGVCTGYISNVRLVKGTAVYTAAFTPPTAPLTAVSGTSLLTLQNATFIDNSTNNFAITVFGNSQPIQFNPFGWTSSTGGNATYSATNYGGSMYFDGTGDYLALPSNSAFAFGTGDFTIEMWAYFASVANFPTLTDSRASTSSTAGFNLGLSSAKVQLYTTSQLLIGATTLTANNWNHIAVTRSGTTLRIFLNGVQDASATNSTNWSDTTLRIGATPDTVNFMTGYIGNLRLVKGQALYTSNFAPPVAPLSFNANTVLQVNGTSAAIYDSAMITTYETVADARSTGVIKKYGNSSLLFDGTGDALYAPWVPSLELGAGSFTIEFWAYIVGGNALYCWSADYHYAMTFNYGGANANRVGIWASSNGSSWNIFNADGGGNGISTGTITTNTWTHVALVRNGSTWTLYLNGTSAWTGTSSATIVTRSTDTFRIGGPWPVAGPTIFNGYMDDFRITPGVARYTTTFTPPTNPVIQF